MPKPETIEMISMTEPNIPKSATPEGPKRMARTFVRNIPITRVTIVAAPMSVVDFIISR
jgi:hypothetical protein